MMQSSSPGTASETWAQTGTTRTGLQPDSDWSCRANCGFELAFRLINDLVLGASVRLGRFAKRFRLKGFNIAKAIPYLGAKYMPLATQIIAINNDINQSKESLMRLRDRLTQIALVKVFFRRG
jgi:hypothetical protein